jgi:hypothetical protein
LLLLLCSNYLIINYHLFIYCWCWWTSIPFPTFILHRCLSTPLEYLRFVSDRFMLLHAPKGFIDKSNFEYIF